MLPCRSSGHPSGCEWLRVSANCRRGRPQLAARGRNLKKNTFPTKPLFFKMLPCHSSGHSSGCFTRNGHLRPLAAHTPVAIRSHSQPLAATRVAASGRFTDNGLAAKCSQPLRPFAATRSHSQPLEWPQVAASGRFTDNGLLQPIAVNPCGHSQPLAATRSHSSGRKWPRVAAPPKWPQVAASGRKWPLQTNPSEWPQVAASGRFRPNQFPPSKQPPCYITLHTYIHAYTYQPT